MMSGILKRSVSSGSRGAMDPIDQFLEQYFLFRKHTSKDSSNLFRVIAEHVYDTQILHYEVRKECVRYMFRKRRSFQRFVSGDYDEYLIQLQKPRTRGTVLELRAMCHLYRRNVIIYEPYNLGQHIIYGKDYPETLRIFLDHKGRFDSVLTMSEMDMAAVAQAVSFNLLYIKVFRLPDVNLAVEWMLYPQAFRWGTDIELDQQGRVIRLLCSNGRSFKLDRPEDTRCILKTYRECPFHNRRLDLHERRLEPMPLSCTRRILEENRLPIPYMVAKSLNPYMYRNVELTCLIADSREAKSMNLYTGDYNFKVGAKCQVELLDDGHRDLSICHIQEISEDKVACQVFVEGLGEFLDVPYDSLHPLPPNEFIPWERPPRCRASKMSRQKRHAPQMNNLSNFQPGRQYQRLKKAAPDQNRRLEKAPNKFQTANAPAQVNQQMPLPIPKLAIAPPNPQYMAPPPTSFSRPVYVPAAQPQGFIQHSRPLMPRAYQLGQLMVRPPGPTYFVAPPGGCPQTGKMPLPYVVHNSPMMTNSPNSPDSTAK
ncbi:protein ovarian tumor locus [Drosophila ficusphila]|uniref:protein ovarian tumor locus n=1 Tax=Drosophila ficusphila TaxID=30025 RepID=UPI001C8A468A|nr:protein ovarian tumor locus [Drosophila ficusphila]